MTVHQLYSEQSNYNYRTLRMSFHLAYTQVHAICIILYISRCFLSWCCCLTDGNQHPPTQPHTNILTFFYLHSEDGHFSDFFSFLLILLCHTQTSVSEAHCFLWGVFSFYLLACSSHLRNTTTPIIRSVL